MKKEWSTESQFTIWVGIIAPWFIGLCTIVHILGGWLT